jgi:RNA-directed DNA polymerase
MEHGNLSSDVKGAIQAVKLLEYEYRCWHRGGLIRSNDFDEWMRRTHSDILFERYADDSICHCHSKSEAEALKQSIQERFTTCGLELNETKTHIVYCKDSNRKENHDKIAFDFLGYTFCPRCVKSKQGKYFTGFNPAISNKAKKRIGESSRKIGI